MGVMAMTGHYQLVLIDGSSYLFRAFHALPQLTSSKGQHTGAVRGVVSMIRRLMNDYPDSHIACVFDAKGKSFRNAIFSDYKANRPPMPDDLRSQIAPIHEIIRLMGVPLLMVEGVEADDVIGTLAGQATRDGMRVLISTGDKDMAQLVDENVTLINTMNDVVMDGPGVEEKFGVRPDQIIDYLALVGDTSDNIPGVPKCGPKTAAKWLATYDTLDAVIENADRIAGKVGENLRAVLPQLRISHELATIKMDVELDESVGDLVLQSADAEGLLEIFSELEFKSWVDELRGASAEALPQVDCDIVMDDRALEELVSNLGSASVLAVCAETEERGSVDAGLVGISFCYGPGTAAYIPLGHTYDGAPAQLPVAATLKKLKPLLEEEDRAIVGHDLKHTSGALAMFGIDMRTSFDTMLASYVLNSVGSRHTLDDLALKHLGTHVRQREEVVGKGKKQIAFSQLDTDTAAHYAAERSDAAFRLHGTLMQKLEEEASLLKVFAEIEMPLVPILSRIERNGVLLSCGLLEDQSKELASRMLELQQEAFSLAGQEFNLGSTKQLQEIFFVKLALPVLKKTPKGQPSTAEPVLQELALDYPLPRVIMEYRGLSKLKSTYTDQLPKQIKDSTGRVHTSYHQAVAATGRLSSTDPNLQNIPIRTSEGRRIRKAFVAPEGYELVAADYSQIELRIMAHLSGDHGLVSAFNQNLDIHRATAAEVFGVPVDEVEDNQRRSAKAINFGLIYGMSAFGLARQLNINRVDSQAYIDLYFERYPGVREYMDATRALAARQGFVETLFGRRLYLPEINASNFQRRQAAERTAINAPMQGSAADIIKRAMVSVDGWICNSGLDARVIMQVHDELVLEARAEIVDELIVGLEEHMCAAASLAIPLVVETGVGASWDAAH